jgi:acyl-CoA synthetase (AMP-forming)/AMP-acid ligase II
MLPNALFALARWSRERPSEIVIRADDGDINYGELDRMVADAIATLDRQASERCAFIMENGPGWIVADLATRIAGCVAVPIPPYFSEAEVEHILHCVGVDTIITDAPERLENRYRPLLLPSHVALGQHPHLQNVHLFRLREGAPGMKPDLPHGSRKVTFTIGARGYPTGVYLDDSTIDRVAHSLLTASAGGARGRHMSILPYSTLMENIAGIDVSLMGGAEICALPLASIGLAGCSSLQPIQLVAALDRYRPSSIVVLPEILQVLVEVAQRMGWRQDYLRHVAIASASLPDDAIRRARQVGLPIFDGFGLSECGSIVTLPGDLPAGNIATGNLGDGPATRGHAASARGLGSFTRRRYRGRR